MSFIIFLLIFGVVHCDDDLETHDLSESPGLIPIELGTNARLHDHYKTSIYTHDLSPMGEQIKSLNNFFRDLKTKIPDNSEIQFLEQKLNRLNEKFGNLSEVENQQRNKRFVGLAISALSLIPSFVGLFTGGGQMDTAKYDSVISRLDAQENSIRVLNQDISLFRKKIKDIKNQLTVINEKHKKLESMLDEVKTNLKSLKVELDRYIFLKSIIDLINHQIDSLSEMVQDIENKFTFARLGVAHPSLISAEDLYDMIDELGLKDEQLLFPLRLKNVDRFHDILSIRAYRSKQTLVFLFSFPVVKRETYKYYKLLSVPIRKGDKFIQMVPDKTYLLTDDKKFILSNSICFNLGETHYCEDYQDFAGEDEMGCLSKVINQESDYSKCKFYYSEIDEAQVTPINKQFYLAVTVKPEKFNIDCTVKKTKQLNGTFLINVPEGCSFTLSTSMYMNNKMDMVKITPIFPRMDSEKGYILAGRMDHKGKIRSDDFKNTHFIVLYGLITVVIVMMVILVVYAICKNRMYMSQSVPNYMYYKNGDLLKSDS